MKTLKHVRILSLSNCKVNMRLQDEHEHVNLNVCTEHDSGEIWRLTSQQNARNKGRSQESSARSLVSFLNFYS